MNRFVLLLGLFASAWVGAYAQNPIIRNQFSADPTARVFEGKVYLYPSHDIPAPADYSRKDWFCMEDYHVFSSDNLTDWKDYGVILNQEDVPWAKPKAYAMWAPDCINRNGKYYFYYPVTPKNIEMGSIGVAIADKPYGPFKLEPTAIKGTRGIDPCAFIDKDGQAYLYWAAGGNIFVAKLKNNMLELDSEPQVIEKLPQGFKEGPFFFERNGCYYLTYPLVIDKTETLAYSMGKTPMGPFEYKGLIMDQSPTACWTNHHSIIDYKGQWYLFYHHNDYSPKFDKNRSVRIDSLSFNADGTIRQVIPTLRGVGITPSTENIQLDRYSRLGEQASIAFIDEKNTFAGWFVRLESKGTWTQYNCVDFETKKKGSTLVMRIRAEEEGVVQIRTDKLDGPIVAEAQIKGSKTWSEVRFPIKRCPQGIHDLYVTLTNGKNVDIDWVTFQ